MSFKTVTDSYKLSLAKQLISDIQTNNYYLFVGNHDLSNTTLADVYARQKDVLVDAYRNMIMGKKIDTNDVKLVIRNIPYESNKVFDMYDDEDEDLGLKDYYTIVDEGSFFHVYKCLDNNFEANSTATPTFSHISLANTEVYQTSDGYRWKYMYSVSDAIESKFASTEYFPLTPNTEVSGSTVTGSLDIVKIEDQGEGYDNYIDGTFVTDDIRINGNNSLFKITSTGASSSNGFYTGCVLYITSGDGSGSYRTIGEYFSNANGNFIVVDEGFTDPSNGSQYQIYPKVQISGSGEETVNAVAWAIVNASNSNSITRIEFLERGENYTYATANVIANSVVAVSREADLRVIMPPHNGHGYDAADELGAHTVCIGTNLANSESNTIHTTNGFKQIGVLKNPLFANVTLTLTDANGTFDVAESVYKINPLQIVTGANLSTTSANVTCGTADFANQISAGSVLYLKSSNGSSHSIATVNSVTNSSHFILTSNGDFACTDTIVYLANIVSQAIISVVSSPTEITITNVNNEIQANDVIIGIRSGAKAVVNTSVRNDVTKAYNTFQQTYKYSGTIDSGAFSNNEIVYQGSLGSANALFHSVVTNGANVDLYTTRQMNVFSVSNTIIGNTSGAVFTPQAVYHPELVSGSGKVVYIENRTAINRAANLTEKFKIYFEI